MAVSLLCRQAFAAVTIFSGPSYQVQLSSHASTPSYDVVRRLSLSPQVTAETPFCCTAVSWDACFEPYKPGRLASPGGGFVLVSSSLVWRPVSTE